MRREGGEEGKPALQIQLTSEGEQTVVQADSASRSRTDSFQSFQSIFEGDQWDISGRNVDSTVSLSQFSVATTASADMSSIAPGSDSSEAHRGNHLGMPAISNSAPSNSLGTPDGTVYSLSRYGTTINEKHSNYVLMYDMLTGIRIAVWGCCLFLKLRLLLGLCLSGQVHKATDQQGLFFLYKAGL